MTGLPSAPIATDECPPTKPSSSSVRLVPDVQAGLSHTYNSKSLLVPSLWLMTGLPSAPIATDE